MRLSKIKLAGFKSFVDPTAVQLPGSLTGIVGPNGCGKSNIIDAVRWVMGEISARHLRGDSMTDVIFNGSGGRKPVGIASVELVFDNSDGAVGGAYANYAEISLKRSVTRDGNSTYFINGAKCRRKDITQLFLGTGLGSRSYAIIEQGMISRLIEAKPEDMRSFIEEAAGISKYKERRRETENRISHTRENLERLNDVREEVDKQIRHLTRQAATARRYQEYKEQERRVHAELLALRMRDLDADLTGRNALTAQRETALQGAIAEQRSVEAAIEQARVRHAGCSDQLGAVQGRYYQAGADATRAEQALAHARELRQRQKADLERLTQALAESAALLDRDQGQLDALAASLAEQEPELERVRAREAESRAGRERADQAMQAWQTGWDTFNREASAASQAAMVERTRIEQLETQLLRQVNRREKLAAEAEQLAGVALDAEIAAHQEREEATRQAGESSQRELADVLARLQQSREDERRVVSELDRARQDLQRARGQIVSLEALQQVALGQVKGKVVEWLAKHDLGARPRLAQQLNVEPGWDRAVETVLGSYLEAVCVDGLDSIAGLLDSLHVGQVTFVGGGAAPGGQAPADGTLLSRVQGPEAVEALLVGIIAVESVAEALARRGSLRPGESVITRDGVWVGRNWLRVSRERDEHAGVIGREKDIRALRDAVRDAEQRVRTLEAGLDDLRRSVTALDARRDELQTRVNRLHRDHVTVRGELESLRARARHNTQRLEQIRGEQQEVAHRSPATKRRSAPAGSGSRRVWNGWRRSMRAGRAGTERDGLRAALVVARDRSTADQAALQATAIKVESQRSTLTSLQTALERLRGQAEQFVGQQAAVREQLAAGEAPVELLQRELEGHLAARLSIEQELAAAREAVEAADQELRRLDEARIGHERRVEEARASLDEVKLSAQEARVRREGLAEQFASTRFELASVVAGLTEEASVAAWEQTLAEITARIERLGAVNLASIDELKEQTERKEYLDRQFADLSEALNTLDQAIRSIDRETRTRFQDTFDRINTGLQQKFPRLFAGGNAYLELVGEDVLSAGVAVMARPPGKRNSTISQLSGGEKALTAVALVFSIFELNPAPFCLLDEVDAPLDESNVGRFCDIVRDMSERVQFIFITHNKVTMELAGQLIGVTMTEPGVSRLVAVDVDEAVRMAAS
ncbi:MAG: chromosome segregation protein SMC [Steroidobacteraceae bacterium]